MRVCIIAEGCYPYVVGGVSSWIHSLIRQYPNIEFVITTVIANRKESGKFVYTFPENVTEIHEVYLDDVQWIQEGKKNRKSKGKLKKEEFEAIRSLVIGEHVDWSTVFRIFQKKDMSLDELFMGEDFLKIVEEIYDLSYTNIIFSDFLWTMRSMYLPLGFALSHHPVKADIYHCVSTGYAGIIGSMAKEFYGGALLLSEHGIYTREREEEIIKAKWVTGVYKDFWIAQFRKLSSCTYQYADIVTSLFEDARALQIDLGCQESKTRVTPNGIDIERFCDIPQKDPDDEMIHIGAIIRVTPIKDVKTLINAFFYAKKREPRLKLWIMGSWDEDEEYAGECFDLVKALNIEDIIFTGKIQVTDYIGKMDMLVLTSISEGQPLTVLEGFAAKKPCIATNVGNCKGLIYGEADEYGPAGLIVPVMNVEKVAEAMVELAKNPQLRKDMGERGYKRVCLRYKIEQMREVYSDIYHELADQYHIEWPTEPFHIEKKEGREWLE